VHRDAPVSTTSKFDAAMPVTCAAASVNSGCGDPLINQSPPLSARIIPYVLSAVHITRAGAVNALQSNQLWRRIRMPIGGRPSAPATPAKCVAGGCNACARIDARRDRNADRGGEMQGTKQIHAQIKSNQNQTHFYL
jgi:hypothetical protein